MESDTKQHNKSPWNSIMETFKIMEFLIMVDIFFNVSSWSGNLL